jgi:hypothetical protein
MKDYLIIATRDPGEAALNWPAELAGALSADGTAVTLLLAENAVLACRPAFIGRNLGKLADEGVEILADRFALDERGIGATAPGIAVTDLGAAVDMLAAGRKAVWI